VPRNTTQLGSFEVNLVQGTAPQRQFTVLVTNEVNQTYFSVLLGERLLIGMQLHPAKSWFFGSKKEAMPSSLILRSPVTT
jgi:hypothetical protein